VCLKRLFCKHDFHLLSTYKKDVDDTVGYKLQEIHIIYCPKCKKEKHVSKHRYEAIMKRQEIDRSYNRQ
jgi:hypothetical protein